jgi:hypothetical protein
METTTTNLSERPRASSRRRTQRIALTVPIECSGKDMARSWFKVITTATSLNRYGGMLHLNRDLPVDSVIVLQNSRGARTSARVVAQRSLAEDHYGYGIEFVDADKTPSFWGIEFPSAFQGTRL